MRRRHDTSKLRLSYWTSLEINFSLLTLSLATTLKQLPGEDSVTNDTSNEAVDGSGSSGAAGEWINRAGGTTTEVSKGQLQ